jgi:hypothetical protein
MIPVFVQTSSANVTGIGTAQIIGVFVQTTDGAILWGPISPDEQAVWLPIEPSGGIWTPINPDAFPESWGTVTPTNSAAWTDTGAGGTIATWTDKVA